MTGHSVPQWEETHVLAIEKPKHETSTKVGRPPGNTRPKPASTEMWNRMAYLRVPGSKRPA